MKKEAKNTWLLAWVVFSTGILYYCYAYLLRVYPSVIEPELMSRFQISADGLGLLTSFYYFAYAPMQLPVGLAVDKIGVRKSLIFAVIVATIGAYIFATVNHFSFALGGRFLVGLGAAFAYVTALKIASLWLPRRYFATATGAVTGAGMIAACVTDISLTSVSEHYSSTMALFIPVIIGIILFAMILFFVRDKQADSNASQEEASALDFKQLGRYLLTIMKNPQMWLIGFLGAMLYLPATVFLDVWGIPYLKTVYHLNPSAASGGISVMLAGWIISSFTTGALSDVMQNRKTFLLVGCIAAAVISSVLLFGEVSGVSLYFLLFALGVACGPHPLCFTLGKENYAPHIAGTAVSFANFVIMLGGFVFQPLVGKFLEWQWDGQIVNGLHQYSPHMFNIALSIIPIGLILGSITTFFIRDTANGETVLVEDDVAVASAAQA